MKIIKKLTILLLLIGIWFIPTTNAYYQDIEISSMNSFTAGCWSPPTAPTLISPLDQSATNSASLILDWTDSSFVCPNQTVEYQYNWNGEDSTWQSASEVTIVAPPEGTYLWKVRAKDSQGYESDWSSTWQVTIDRTSPTTKLFFNSYEINENVINGDFENGLYGWTTQGKVVIWPQKARHGPGCYYGKHSST